MSESLYDISETQNEVLLNEGFDYSNVLMQKTLSNYLFRNENISGFITYINDIMVNLIESVKIVRVFQNFTVNKNYKKIN